MKVVAFLPVKGASERVKNKNTRLLDGKELFLHMLEKLEKCEAIDEIYLDSESDHVFEIAGNGNFHKLRRDPALASNTTDGNRLFMNEVHQVDADIYVQILCTSPFIKVSTIDRAIEQLAASEKYDSAVLVKSEKLYSWQDGKPSYDINNIPNSKDLPDTVIETMGLYLIKREAALETQRRIGNHPMQIEADALEGIDVNYPDEFDLANYIMAGIRESETVRFRNLSKLLSSAMLSDILDDLHVDTFIGALTPNISGKKVMGRAKTLALRALEPGEDYKGIYQALDSYNYLVPGDIVVVENEASEFAYFGGLNASLAVRCGAAAAIIGGKTRDHNEVSQLDFPVFSTGYSARDVRHRATVKTMNKPVNLFGVDVVPGDIIFADRDGVIVIPAAIEKKVISMAMNTLRKENAIVSDIVDATDGNSLVAQHGEF